MQGSIETRDQVLALTCHWSGRSRQARAGGSVLFPSLTRKGLCGAAAPSPGAGTFLGRGPVSSPALSRGLRPGAEWASVLAHKRPLWLSSWPLHMLWPTEPHCPALSLWFRAGIRKHPLLVQWYTPGPGFPLLQGSLSQRGRESPDPRGCVPLSLVDRE